MNSQLSCLQLHAAPLRHDGLTLTHKYDLITGILQTYTHTYISNSQSLYLKSIKAYQQSKSIHQDFHNNQLGICRHRTLNRRRDWRTVPMSRRCYESHSYLRPPYYDLIYFGYSFCFLGCYLFSVFV